MKNHSIKYFVASSLFGIAAGMILLPQLEPETRKKIVSKGKDIMEDTSNMISGQEHQ